MDELLALRLGLLAILFVFILVVATGMRSGVRIQRQLVAAPRSRSGQAVLRVVSPASSGLEAGLTFELAGVMTLGRDDSNSIVIPDPSVSSRHASLSLERGSWRLRDLQSTNGTFVEDRRLDSRATSLRHGMRIAIGAVVFTFES